MTKRKEILSKVLDQLHKEADVIPETTTVVEPEVDQATADKMAKDIFDQLFNDEIRNLINQS